MASTARPVAPDLDGQRVRHTARAAAETGGEFPWGSSSTSLPAGWVPPPPHVHRRQVEGGGRSRVASTSSSTAHRTPLGPGDGAIWCRSEPSTRYRNRSGRQGHVRNWRRPAMHFEAPSGAPARPWSEAGVRPREGADPRITLLPVSKVVLGSTRHWHQAADAEQLPMKALARIAGFSLPDPGRRGGANETEEELGRRRRRALSAGWKPPSTFRAHPRTPEPPLTRPGGTAARSAFSSPPTGKVISTARLRQRSYLA